jgi:uncharacterized membrane protein
MTVDPIILVTIVGMAIVTYATRIAGFALLSRAGLSGRLVAWLGYVPGAVLMSIVAPSAWPTGLTEGIRGESGAPYGSMPEAVGAVVTALVAVRFKNLLLAMVAGVVTVWLLRRVVGAT